ncbi:hypothetical protein J1N35_012170 [Gossypium stocksii]|uniref:Phospholipase A1 n=1 Tax=Gossypium stocksii TaxID=47602 RepID=A0A9D4AC54_9ROSI|nr:hypothetical protein J1N35_012170 [Gossypium stocksii]
MVKSDKASQWRVLSGENNWDGLLQPLNLDLRRYIIHYGQRAGSVGDLYNQNKHGEFPKEKFFAEAGLEKGNRFKYSVTHYIHAGSDIVEPAWRDILIAWRGTIHYTEWFNDLIAALKSALELFGTGTEAKVHSGFLSLYSGTRSNSVVDNLSARHQVRDALRELMDKYKDEEISITVTGFSLGGALATLNAMDIANEYNKPSSTLLGANNPCMVTTFTFGSPQVGDFGFKQLFKKLVDHHHLRLLRIRNANDPVHKWPFSTFTHVGEKLTIYSNESPYLKHKLIFGRSLEGTYNPPSIDYYPNIVTEEEIIASRGLVTNWIAGSVSAHNMDVYLHGIAGLQEGTFGFHLEVDLDIALVNKYLDRLKDEYEIPDHWWKGENCKRMVQEDNGHWKVKG